MTWQNVGNGADITFENQVQCRWNNGVWAPTIDRHLCTPANRVMVSLYNYVSFLRSFSEFCKKNPQWKTSLEAGFQVYINISPSSPEWRQLDQHLAKLETPVGVSQEFQDIYIREKKNLEEWALRDILDGKKPCECEAIDRHFIAVETHPNQWLQHVTPNLYQQGIQTYHLWRQNMINYCQQRCLQIQQVQQMQQQEVSNESQQDSSAYKEETQSEEY